VSYLESPDGFARDKEFLQWFIKNARMLYDAGWMPVTYATVNHADVVCERYGNGKEIYFTLGNLSFSPQKVELTVDLPALGVANAVFTEVSRGNAIETSIDGKTGRVRVTLPANETWIVKLTK